MEDWAFLQTYKMWYEHRHYQTNQKYVQYEKTSICLKLNGSLTPPLKTYRGVRQGCTLSPRVFNYFINDIPKIFDNFCEPVKLGSEKLNCLMYADDLVILSESENGLQECLNRLQKYTLEWHLSINMKKTKIISFTKNGHIPKKDILLGQSDSRKNKELQIPG